MTFSEKTINELGVDGSKKRVLHLQNCYDRMIKEKPLATQSLYNLIEERVKLEDALIAAGISYQKIYSWQNLQKEIWFFSQKTTKK